MTCVKTFVVHHFDLRKNGALAFLLQNPEISVYARFKNLKVFMYELCHFYHAGGFYRGTPQEYLILLDSFLLRCIVSWILFWMFIWFFFAVSQHPLCPFKFCDGKSRKYPALQPVAPADEDLREHASWLTAMTSSVPTFCWPQESMIKKGSSYKT